jgi:hypothetical protein
MTDIMIDGVKLRQQYRKCSHGCETCTKGPGHGPYYYASRPGEALKYLGKELPPAIAEHLAGLKADAADLQKLREELARDVVDADTAAQHAHRLLRALDDLCMGISIDAGSLKELGLERFAKVKKSL